MLIKHTEIYKYSIPMVPFTIATGTMHYAQNIFIRIYTDAKITGVGECSAFPIITGETQNTCFYLAQDFALLWKHKNPADILQRLQELEQYIAYNHTIKSAFDMALYDIVAQAKQMPLWQYLGGVNTRELVTDITIGIGMPQQMAVQAAAFQQQGFNILKVKLGKAPDDDIARIAAIRQAVGSTMKIRIDANQGWSFEDACKALTALHEFEIEFCEQPMHKRDDGLLPALKKISPIAIMADESVFDHHDAKRLIASDSCSAVNIKFAKTGGISEAIRVHDVCSKNNIPCMMGGMLESRVALTAFAHFATAMQQVVYYDMDTCMLGHKADPVTGGVYYAGDKLLLPGGIGINANVDEEFLKQLEQIVI